MKRLFSRLTNLLPAGLRDQRLAAHLSRTVERLSPERRELGARGNPRLQRIVIVPADLRTLDGSRGDEAMMLAVLNRLRQIQPKLRGAVRTSSPVASKAA